MFQIPRVHNNNIAIRTLGNAYIVIVSKLYGMLQVHYCGNIILIGSPRWLPAELHCNLISIAFHWPSRLRCYRVVQGCMGKIKNSPKIS